MTAQHHLNQAAHNRVFHTALETKFPFQFHDWKVTSLFYTAVHYLHALAAAQNIDIGHSHWEVAKSVNPKGENARMPLTPRIWKCYNHLKRYSQSARYDGFHDAASFEQAKARDHAHAYQLLKELHAYMASLGLAA